MCQHPACAAETRIRSKDCDVTIADRMGSRDAFPIPFPSFIYAQTKFSLASALFSFSMRAGGHFNFLQFCMPRPSLKGCGLNIARQCKG